MIGSSELKQKRRASTFERVFALVSALGAISAFVLVRQIDPVGTTIFPVCPFHAITGLNCPGCGATRGMHALLNGDILAALHFNALLVVFVPLMIYAVIALILYGVRGRGLTAPRLSAQGIWALLILLIAFGILRNLPFYPFSLLAI